MAITPAYSTLFSCIHDEPEPVGNLGRGTHYSVMRSVEWLDVMRNPLEHPHVHDFAVIWDEDHDKRIIEVVEALYMTGLLSPVQFIGERKGTLTVIVAAKFYFGIDKSALSEYTKKVSDIANSPSDGDSWPCNIGYFDRSPGDVHQTDLQSLVNDRDHRVLTYVRNIDSLWALGTRPYARPQNPEDDSSWVLPSIPLRSVHRAAPVQTPSPFERQDG